LALVTFVIVFLVVYLVKMLPIEGRAKQIVNGIVIVIGIIHCRLLRRRGARRVV